MLRPVDRRRLTMLLAKQAAVFSAGPTQYFRDLVKRASLPVNWQLERAASGTGDPKFEAGSLVDWAVVKGTNPSDPNWTTLGSLLRVLLEDGDLGVEDAAQAVALIEVYRLSKNARTSEALRTGFAVPALLIAPDAEPADEGPSFEWRGPVNSDELHGWRIPEPPLMDVAFLAQAIRSATTVCRVFFPSHARSGTGVRIAPTLVLTNHHVVHWDSGADLTATLADAELHFAGMRLGESGNGGLMFKLAQADPLCRWSAELDFALLRVDAAILDDDRSAVASFRPSALAVGAGINLLQHPQGGSMKLAISPNGVTSVSPRSGILQYVTTAARGSSGAPCFDDQWNLVAIHHAQRARPFGRVGEGILMDAIWRNIADVCV